MAAPGKVHTDWITRDLLRVNAPFVQFYVARDTRGLYLIDSGFLGGVGALKRALWRVGWASERIRGIVLTHGHLDHLANVAAIIAETGAWLAAPQLDAAHLAGTYPYRGPARVCGYLEQIGRTVLRLPPLVADHWLVDGDEVPIQDGWEVIDLPGHTTGHAGFFLPRHQLVFSGDLFASYGIAPHWPPAIFNSCPELLAASRQRLFALELRGILPNHGDAAPPHVHLERLRQLGAPGWLSGVTTCQSADT